jgi:large subunit ribosomal protein L23
LVDIMTVQYPLLSEKTVGLIEKENRIIFIVDKTAKKGDIKTAVEKMYGVKVMSINTMVSSKGVKKAYVKLAPEFKATDLAAKLKIL